MSDTSITFHCGSDQAFPWGVAWRYRDVGPRYGRDDIVLHLCQGQVVGRSACRTVATWPWFKWWSSSFGSENSCAQNCKGIPFASHVPAAVSASSWGHQWCMGSSVDGSAKNFVHWQFGKVSTHASTWPFDGSHQETSVNSRSKALDRVLAWCGKCWQSQAH